jgi:hypothetical protein
LAKAVSPKLLASGDSGFDSELIAAACALRGQITAAGPVSDADGYDLRPDPLTAQTPAQFTAALRQFRLWAGNPSLRKISRRSGTAASTLCSALRSTTLPTYAVVQAVITGCDGSPEDLRRFTTAWRSLRFQQENAGLSGQHEPGGRAA